MRTTCRSAVFLPCRNCGGTVCRGHRCTPRHNGSRMFRCAAKACTSKHCVRVKAVAGPAHHRLRADKACVVDAPGAGGTALPSDRAGAGGGGCSAAGDGG